jgi:hypothetical protein
MGAGFSLWEPLWGLDLHWRHVLFRFCPDYEVPIGAQYLQLKTYDVQAKAESIVFAVPPIDIEMAMTEEDKSREELEEDRNKRVKENKMKAINLHRGLTSIVTNRSDIFDIPSNAKVTRGPSSAIVDRRLIRRHRPFGCSRNMNWQMLLLPWNTGGTPFGVGFTLGKPLWVLALHGGKTPMEPLCYVGWAGAGLLRPNASHIKTI